MCRYIKHSREEWASEHYLLFAEKTYENLDVKFSSSAGPGLGCPQSFGHPSPTQLPQTTPGTLFPRFPLQSLGSANGKLDESLEDGKEEKRGGAFYIWLLLLATCPKASLPQAWCCSLLHPGGPLFPLETPLFSSTCPTSSLTLNKISQFYFPS